MTKVLWIEDDYDRIKGLTRPLEKNGFQITPVTDTESFFTLENKYNFDLYIVDLILPQKKNYDTLDPDEFENLPGIKIVHDLNSKGKKIIVLSVVSEKIMRTLKRKYVNVLKIIKKGNVFPSDFRELVLELFGENIDD